MTPSDRLDFILQQAEYLRGEIALLQQQLDGYDHRTKFEKAKTCLRMLYRDQTYSSRSDWVNKVLDDPEVQGWIREED